MYIFPRVNETQFSHRFGEPELRLVLTLLTLSEARGGGVSVRSLIISTSETYCKFMSKMSAWLGFPLEEGHSGEKIKLRKTGASRALTTYQREHKQLSSHKAHVNSVPQARAGALQESQLSLGNLCPPPSSRLPHKITSFSKP